MRVFISWSGELSEEIAEELKGWLPDVIQALDPWISSRDISKGSVWQTELHEELRDQSVGIFCLTKENVRSPWINFEAGAISKALDDSRVMLLLIDLEPQDVEPPLGQFQATKLLKDDMRQMIGDLNKLLPDRPLSEDVLDRSFDTNWTRFQRRVKKLLAQSPATTTVERSPEEMLEEVLLTVRRIERRGLTPRREYFVAPVAGESVAGAADPLKSHLRNLLAHSSEPLDLYGFGSPHSYLFVGSSHGTKNPNTESADDTEDDDKQDE